MKQNLTPRLNRLEPNIVIDGGMRIWPEGATRTVASASNAYGAALFKLFNETSGVTLTNSRQTAAPSNTNLVYSNQISKTASGTLQPATAIVLRHDIEGINVDRILDNEFSLIFWVKSSVASNRSISLINASSSHSMVKQYNIAAANTWELKVISFPALSTCPGVIERTNGSGIAVRWGVVVGSNQQTSSLGTWLSGGFSAGIGEDTTWLTGTTHDFNVSGVMVMPGNWEDLTAAEYEFVGATSAGGNEQERVFRYWQSTYDGPNGLPNATPRGNVGNGNGEIQVRWPTAPSSSDELFAAMPLKAQMRALPTVELWSTAGAQNNFQRDGGGAITAQLWNAGRNFHQIVATNSQASNTAVHRIHIIADARF